MRRVPRIILIASFVVGAALVGGITYYAANHFLADNSQTASKIFTCATRHVNHQVKIQYSVIMPIHTQARLCDSLTITNRDDRLRLIAFGPHDHHAAYDGVTEKTLGLDQSLTITLNQLGTYSFHDHIADQLVGSFTVSN